jgi:hypothetical protein
MGAENIVQAGIEINSPDGKKRIFKLGMHASAWLAEKHGTIKKVYSKLSGEIGNDGKPIDKGEEGDMTECQINALVDIAYAGFIRDAEENGETFTRNDAMKLLDDIGIAEFFAIISGGLKKSMPDVEPDPTAGSATK